MALKSVCVVPLCYTPLGLCVQSQRNSFFITRRDPAVIDKFPDPLPWGRQRALLATLGSARPLQCGCPWLGLVALKDTRLFSLASPKVSGLEEVLALSQLPFSPALWCGFDAPSYSPLFCFFFFLRVLPSLFQGVLGYCEHSRQLSVEPCFFYLL